MKSKNHHLFTVGNAKTVKSQKVGYLTLILHLMPSTANARKIDLCPFASNACRALCLVNSGRSEIFRTINKARLRKTEEFLSDREGFTLKLIQEIKHYQKVALRKGLKLAVRLNGTSDISWYKIKYAWMNLFEIFPKVQFYDYTKNPFIAYASEEIKNYDITFSWSGNNASNCHEFLGYGFNVAVPFAGLKRTEEVPKEYLRKEVIDGDKTDLRFLDKKGRIVGLRVKGSEQKKAESNFLVKVERKAS